MRRKILLLAVLSFVSGDSVGSSEACAPDEEEYLVPGTYVVTGVLMKSLPYYLCGASGAIEGMIAESDLPKEIPVLRKSKTRYQIAVGEKLYWVDKTHVFMDRPTDGESHENCSPPLWSSPSRAENPAAGTQGLGASSTGGCE